MVWVPGDVRRRALCVPCVNRRGRWGHLARRGFGKRGGLRCRHRLRRRGGRHLHGLRGRMPRRRGNRLTQPMPPPARDAQRRDQHQRGPRAPRLAISPRRIGHCSADEAPPFPLARRFVRRHRAPLDCPEPVALRPDPRPPRRHLRNVQPGRGIADPAQPRGRIGRRRIAHHQRNEAHDANALNAGSRGRFARNVELQRPEQHMHVNDFHGLANRRGRPPVRRP